MKNIIAILFLGLVGFLMFYFGLPVINYGFVGFAIIILALTVLALVLSTGIQISRNAKQVKILNKPNIIFFLIIGALLFYIVGLPLLTSLPMFRSESYKNLIGKVADGTKIANHIAPISIDEIRVVDEDLAYLLGEKYLVRNQL